MNSVVAKLIDLPRLLQVLGHKPCKVLKGGMEVWYLSPYRFERSPSFHASYLSGKWIWKDFGTGDGGTVIDFAVKYWNCSSIQDGLQHLKSVQPELNKVHDVTSTDSIDASRMSIELKYLSDTVIKHPVIVKYLTEIRKIPIDIAMEHLREVHYLNKGKRYYAFGMQNRIGGYEIRSASDNNIFKSALNGRDITFISNSSNGTTSINIFEGMIDYLSVLAMTGSRLTGDAIVMHGLGMYNRTVEIANRYCQVNLFLDNDEAGIAHTNRFIKNTTSATTSMSKLMLYKDWNLALQAGYTLLTLILILPISHLKFLQINIQHLI